MMLALVALALAQTAYPCNGAACVGTTGQDVILGGQLKATVGPLGDGGTAYLKPAIQGVPLVIQSEQPTGTSAAAAVTVQASNKHDGGTIFSVKNGNTEVFSVGPGGASGGTINPTTINATVVNAGFVDAGNINVLEGGILRLGAGKANLYASDTNTVATGFGQVGANLSVLGTLRVYNSFAPLSAVYDNNIGIGAPTERFLSLYLGTGIYLGGGFTHSGVVAAIASGFGTNPVITGRGVAFKIDVGTGGSASAGVVGFTTVASTGWVCQCTAIPAIAATATEMTANSTTGCTVSNLTLATGVAAAWTANTILWCTATGVNP